MLDDKQHGVLKGIVIGAATTMAVIVIAVLLHPLPFEFSSGADMAERIAYALKADILLAICLVASIGRLAGHRFFTPDDIDGRGLAQGTPRAKVLQSTLQNTLEQTVLAVTVHLIWAVSEQIENATGRDIFGRNRDSKKTQESSDETSLSGDASDGEKA